MKCDYSVKKSKFWCFLSFELVSGTVSTVHRCLVQSERAKITFDNAGNIVAISADSSVYLGEDNILEMTTVAKEVIEEFKVSNLLK